MRRTALLSLVGLATACTPSEPDALELPDAQLPGMFEPVAVLGSAYQGWGYEVLPVGYPTDVEVFTLDPNQRVWLLARPPRAWRTASRS